MEQQPRVSRHLRACRPHFSSPCRRGLPPHAVVDLTASAAAGGRSGERSYGHRQPLHRPLLISGFSLDPSELLPEGSGVRWMCERIARGGDGEVGESRAGAAARAGSGGGEGMGVVEVCVQAPGSFI
jgi:hypothetical protein